MQDRGGAMGVVVVVTGVPGAGKTTLARRLSVELCVPLLSLDTVKEALFDTLGVRDRAWAGRLRDASLEVLIRLIHDSPTGAVLDLWFAPERDRRVLDPLGGGPWRVVEIQCVVPGDVAAVRYAARARHPGHLQPDEDTLERIRAAARSMAALGIGPHTTVDCTSAVDVDAVVRWIVGHGPPQES